MSKSLANNATATTARQWQILSQLDRKRWLGTTHIKEQLDLMGFDISLRTIQRDLNALATRFPIEKNNTNPQGWRWREDAPMQSLPHMNLSQAVAFSMMRHNLTQLLPPAILDELIPWFDLANRQLKESKVVNTWLDRVRILSANQPLIPPSVNPAAKDAVYDALFQNKKEVDILDVYNAIKNSKRIYPDSIIKELDEFRVKYEDIAKSDNIVLPIVKIEEVQNAYDSF